MTPPATYRFTPFRLDPRNRELREGGGAPIALTAKAFDTLCVLVENRHRVMSKDELLAAVWPGRVVEENNLSQAISAVRRALGTDASDHRYLVTVPGRGYRFVADVQSGDVDPRDTVVPMAPTAPDALPGAAPLPLRGHTTSPSANAARWRSARCCSRARCLPSPPGACANRPPTWPQCLPKPRL